MHSILGAINVSVMYVVANLAKHTTGNKIEHRVRSTCPFACLQICQRSRVVTYNVGSRNLSFDFFDKSTNKSVFIEA